MEDGFFVIYDNSIRMGFTAKCLNSTCRFVFMNSLLTSPSNIVMQLFKSFLSLLIAISILSDALPAETPISTIASSQQPQSAIKFTLQYPNNWKISQAGLFDTKNQLLVKVKTSWNQLYSVSSSIWLATHDVLVSSKEATSTDPSTTFFSQSPITQWWNIYNSNEAKKFSLFLGKSNSIARNVLKSLSESHIKNRQVKTFFMNPDSSSAFVDVCKVLKSAGYYFQHCCPKTKTLCVIHKTIDVLTTSIDMGGMPRNEIKQWSEARQGKITCTPSDISSNTLV